jgi:hypothetical protein
MLPKLIESDEELDRLVTKMEALDRKATPTPEEEALSSLLLKLIKDYDDLYYPLPASPPHKIIRFLMEHTPVPSPSTPPSRTVRPGNS